MHRMTRVIVAPMIALAIALAFSTLARAADDKATNGTVSGTVVDKDGKAVAGAKIRIVAAGKKKDSSGATSSPASPGDTSGGTATTKPKAESIAEGTTDVDGKFSL